MESDMDFIALIFSYHRLQVKIIYNTLKVNDNVKEKKSPISRLVLKPRNGGWSGVPMSPVLYNVSCDGYIIMKL